MKAGLVLLILMALTARGEDLAGHYILQGVMEVGSELVLKTDGNFEYMLAYGAADYWSRGKWGHEDNTVVLNSAGKKEPPFRFVRSEAGKPDGIRISVIGKNGHGVENIELAIQAGEKHLEARTGSDGVAEFPDVDNVRAARFEVPVYSIKAGPFTISPSHHAFFFEINGDAITQVLFKDEHLTIEGNDLVMKFWNGKEPFRYEKESER